MLEEENHATEIYGSDNCFSSLFRRWRCSGGPQRLDGRTEREFQNPWLRGAEHSLARTDRDNRGARVSAAGKLVGTDQLLWLRQQWADATAAGCRPESRP